MEAEVWGDVEETGWETINKEHQDVAGSDWSQTSQTTT